MRAECPHCLEPVPALEGTCPRCRQDLARKPEADELVGHVFAESFEIEERLGIGAMGRVYRARQISLDKIVAIKVLHRHLAGDPKLAKRFHREARAASRLDHPNSLQIIDFGQAADGTLYIAMEHLVGRTLDDVLGKDFPFSPARMVHILGQVCDALEDAHAAGIVHRDLKPENILLVARRGDPDFVKVCDFGIAKIQDPKADDTDAQITMAGLVCGTPEYMSPEQARGDPLDGRTDLYALGVIGYQMLTGGLPFTAQTALGVITKHLTDEVIPPRVSRTDLAIDARLEGVIMKVLTKEREGRQRSAAELKRDLQAAAAAMAHPDARQDGAAPSSLPAVARTIMSGEIQAVPRRRRGGVWAGAALLAIGLAAGGWIFLRTQPPSAPAPRHAVRPPPAAPARPVLPQPLERPSPVAPPLAPLADAGPLVADASVSPPLRPTPTKRAKLLSDAGPIRIEPAPQAVDSGRAVYEEGRRLFQSSQYAQAIAKYREAERLGFGGAALQRSLGQAYARIGNVAAMCEAYRRVLRARPDVILQGIVDAQCR